METEKTIYSKLLDFQTTIEKIKKDGQNTFFKKPDGKASTYATLPNILAEVKPLLNVMKILVTQPIINNEVLTVLTDLETGEQIKSGITIPNGLNAQQTGSAITYFRRYTISSLLALEIDIDDDGNAASVQSKPQQKESDNRPWLTEKLLCKAIERIKEGDVDVYQKTIDAYRMKKEYRQLLEKLLA